MDKSPWVSTPTEFDWRNLCQKLVLALEKVPHSENCYWHVNGRQCYREDLEPIIEEAKDFLNRSCDAMEGE